MEESQQAEAYVSSKRKGAKGKKVDGIEINFDLIRCAKRGRAHCAARRNGCIACIMCMRCELAFGKQSAESGNLAGPCGHKSYGSQWGRPDADR